MVAHLQPARPRGRILGAVPVARPTGVQPDEFAQLDELEHEMRDAHTDNTYTATTEFEYTRGGMSVGGYSIVQMSEY